MRELKAFIFDLDGVLTDTTRFHYLAWKEIAVELGLKFDIKDNERLKGVSRRRSFEIILEINDKSNAFSEMEISDIILRKNKRYCEMIGEITPKDVMNGIISLLEKARKEKILLAVASASNNAKVVLKQLQMEHYFDYIADASKIVNTKPDPEVFLVCAQNLGLANEDCVGFEDSQAGIEAIHAAGMFSVGIGVEVTSIEPAYSLTKTEELDIVNIIQEFGKWSPK